MRYKQGFLTPKELEVLKLISKDRETIGQELNIKLATVQIHIRHLYQKFNAFSRAEIVIKALKKGVIKLEDFKYGS